MLKIAVKYGLILFITLAVLKALEYSFFSYKITLQTYLGLVAIGFTLIGSAVVWFLTSRQSKPDQNAAAQNAEPDAELLSKFSERELEILRCVAHGYTNKEVAQMLEISPNTIKTHLSNLYTKLGVSNRTQAAAEAKALNLIK